MMSRAKQNSSGRFITIEGGEGAGKSTLIGLLEKQLISQGYVVVKTREPGGTELGNQIRSWLLMHNMALKIDAKAELLLFLAARAQHIEEVILPALDAGKVVICDRYNDSTIAYQGAGRGLGIEWVRDLCHTISDDVHPDLTYYLDVDPTIGLQRTKKATKENASAGEMDRIESEKRDFHERVRAAFIDFAQAEPQRFAVIDANQPQKVVIQQALTILKEFFTS